MAEGLARDPSRNAAHGWTFLKNVILLALDKNARGNSSMNVRLESLPSHSKPMNSKRIILAGVSAMIIVTPLLRAANTDYQVQPISVRYAQTASKITVDTTMRYFEDVQLQEMNHFDGWGCDLEATVPFYRTLQFRLLWPLYTEGDATVIGTGQRSWVRGWGGVLDLPSVILEHQLLSAPNHGFNFAWYLGAGGRVGFLETAHGDRLNHQGRLYQAGVKADRSFNDDQVRLLANLGVRAYIKSDDLNPSRGNDDFFLVDLNTASVTRLHEHFWPGMGLNYQGEFEKYNSVSLLPQAIIPVNSWLEVKFGVPFRLTSHGERVGLRLQLTARF